LKYKQTIISGLNEIKNTRKITGRGYAIFNATDKIKDTIIGTIISIISSSSVYEDGTVLIGMAYDNEKIKVSARLSGRTGRNLREILEQVISKIGGEFGGHAQAAGAVIDKIKEQEFIKEIKSSLEIELVKL
ncbi:MAG: DHH family phosphoesterase, partial [Nanoarchaeota archaeon]